MRRTKPTTTTNIITNIITCDCERKSKNQAFYVGLEMVGNLFLHEQRTTMVLTVDSGRIKNITNLTNINNQWLIIMSLTTKW